MVAHTGNSTMTTTPSNTLPTNNYLPPTIKMNLPQNLRKYFLRKKHLEINIKKRNSYNEFS